MSDDERFRCACGWLRPSIAITMADHSEPPPGLVPFYMCPQCGAFHSAGETTIERLAEIRKSLERQVATARASLPEPVHVFQVRARKATVPECYFCGVARLLKRHETTRQAAVAMAYIVGHKDEATHDGPPLCPSCTELTEYLARELVAREPDGKVYDRSFFDAAGGRKPS